MLSYFQFKNFKIRSHFKHHTVIILTFILFSAPSIYGYAAQEPDCLSRDSVNSAAKIKFDLLHDASVKNYEAWSGNVWGTMGSLVLVLGWLLTSGKSRLYLHKNNQARNVAIVVVAVIAIINVVLNVHLAQKSAEIQNDIRENEYVIAHAFEPEHYGYYHVPYLYAVLSDILVGTVFILIIFVLRSLAKWIEPEATGKG